MSQLRKGVAILCGALFAAIFVVFCYAVLRRYLAGDAVAWAGEVTVVLFIWLIFLANAALVPDDRQIRFDLLLRHLPRRARTAAEVLRDLAIAALFLAALPGSLGYIRFLWRERTPVLQWRLDWVYACFGVFMVAVILRRAWQVLLVARRRAP